MLIKKAVLLTAVIWAVFFANGICEVEELLTKDDRILVLAPHPDDEVLGASGVISRALRAKAKVKVVFLTYGDVNEWSFLIYKKHPVLMPESVKQMALVRHDEACDACELLGLSKHDLVFLGYPDFGTLKMIYAHGAGKKPYRAILTKADHVPYENAYRPGTPYLSENMIKDLALVINDFKPTKIIVSHPADRNADHQAFYLLSRVVLWDLEYEHVKVLPYLIHFVNWPNPKGYFPEEMTVPPLFFKKKIKWAMFELTRNETAKKYKALKRYRSQYMSNKTYLESFVRANEMFGDFADIALPKPGQGKLAIVDEAGVPDGADNGEKKYFVDIVERAVWKDKNMVVFNIKLSKPLADKVGLEAYFFGYRSDNPFSKMPKVHIKLGAMRYDVFADGVKMKRDKIKITREASDITVRIPLELLGYPEKILTSANSYIGRATLDWAAWRVITL